MWGFYESKSNNKSQTPMPMLNTRPENEEGKHNSMNEEVKLLSGPFRDDSSGKYLVSKFLRNLLSHFEKTWK
jgi:hypothetical protein